MNIIMTGSTSFVGAATVREIGIQLELIAGTAVYVYEFSRRQAAKLGAKA